LIALIVLPKACDVLPKVIELLANALLGIAVNPVPIAPDVNVPTVVIEDEPV